MLLHAAPPVLPFDSDLGPATSVFDPQGKYARRGLWFLLGTLILSAPVFALHPHGSGRGVGTLYAVELSPLIALIGILFARRSYEAVGAGWVYVRRSMVGPGKFIRFDQLTSVDVVDGRYNPPSLVLRDKRGTTIKFSTKRLRLDGRTFGRDLAQGIERSGVAVRPRAQEFLRVTSGTSADDEQAKHFDEVAVRSRDARVQKKLRPYGITMVALLIPGVVIVVVNAKHLDSGSPWVSVGGALIIAACLVRMVATVVEFIARRAPRDE